MLCIGECVLHQKTGQMGIVIGYGHEILNDVYTTTLKVLVDYDKAMGKQEVVEESSNTAWVKWLSG